MTNPPDGWSAPAGSPRAALNRLLMGQVVAQAVYAAAKLGLADLLVAGSQSVAALAAATDTNPDALARLLRTLAGHGVFAEVAPDHFGLTPIAECLRDGRLDSARPAAIMYGEEYRRAMDDLVWSVQTGEPSFERRHGAPFFEYLTQDPEAGQRFDRNMSGRFAARNAAVVAAYDFSPVATLVDVGGGAGGLLRAVLAAYPALRGMLFDLPPVVERARQGCDPSADERLALVGGDFFAEVPAGADAYALASILHDWDDEPALAILRTVRRAIAPAGRLLVIEEVLPPGDEPSPARLLDLLMLTLVGGRERTAADFGALLAAAGFALTRIVPTATGTCVIEAVPT